MIFTSFRQTDSYYEFSNDTVNYIIPVSDVILIDDESGFLAVKLIASRKTIGLVKKNN